MSYVGGEIRIAENVRLLHCHGRHSNRESWMMRIVNNCLKKNKNNTRTGRKLTSFGDVMSIFFRY